jgi:5-methylcytosine-specific restriction endonuclease McrA
MADILHTPNVLRLNANRMRLGWATPAQAFCMMMGESADGSPPALAYDIQYELNEFGQPILEKWKTMETMEWEYWLMCQPRVGELDQVIHTSKRIIRVPTIIVCSKFFQMPKKEQRATSTAIRRRDGNRCQYSGVELTNKTFSLDHVKPKSKGGKDSWENLVSCHKDINSRKGDRFNHEVGLTLRKTPVAPKALPLCALFTENKHPDHYHF